MYIQLLKGEKVSQAEGLAYLRGTLTPVFPAQHKWAGCSLLYRSSHIPDDKLTAFGCIQSSLCCKYKYKHPNLH